MAPVLAPTPLLFCLVTADIDTQVFVSVLYFRDGVAGDVFASSVISIFNVFFHAGFSWRRRNECVSRHSHVSYMLSGVGGAEDIVASPDWQAPLVFV